MNATVDHRPAPKVDGYRILIGGILPCLLRVSAVPLYMACNCLFVPAVPSSAPHARARSKKRPYLHAGVVDVFVNRKRSSGAKGQTRPQQGAGRKGKRMDKVAWKEDKTTRDFL